MDTLKKQMEELYVKKDYSALQEILLKNRDQFSDGQFYYNYGTLFLKMGKLGPARFNLEKAINEGWINSSVKKNYSLVYSSVAVDPMKSNHITDQAKAIVEACPWWGILITGLVILNALLFLLAKKRLLLKKFIVSFVALSFLFAGLSMFKGNLSSAIVLKDTIIKEGPSKIYEDVGTLQGGAKIIIDRIDSGWMLISAPREYVGWVKAQDIGVLR